jgi:protocatechuate 3,4-dioxygenase beta subunit
MPAFSTAAAQVSLSTSNVTAGAAAGWTIAGLQPSASYYFSLWASDDAGNWSAASNVAGAETSSASPGFISGAVRQSDGTPIQGVLVDVYGADGLLKAGDTTDAFGAYEVTGLEIGDFTVRATWSADDIVSYVSKDAIPSGTPGVDFALSVSYQLASVSGTIPAAFTALSPQAGFKTASAGGTGLWVEVYKLGRLVARAEADAAGRFTVSNLLPGTYSLRAYNGKEYTEPVTVKLAQGQEYFFRPVFSTLMKDRVFAYPNPARTRAHIHFDSSFALGAFRADIAVFDLGGRLVKRFSEADAADDTDYAGGSGYRVTWDLERDKVAPGVYFYSVEVEGTAGEKAEKVVRKLAVIR